MKINELAGLGITVSFANNLIASANACKAPNKPTTFGPRRRCTAPKNLRSKTVKNATAKIIGKKVNKNFTQSIPAKNKTYITLIFIQNKGKNIKKNHFIAEKEI